MLNKYKWSVKIGLRMKRKKGKINKSRIDEGECLLSPPYGTPLIPLLRAERGMKGNVYSPRLTAPLSYRSYELKGECLSSTNIVDTFFMYLEGISLESPKGDK